MLNLTSPCKQAGMIVAARGLLRGRKPELDWPPRRHKGCWKIISALSEGGPQTM